jgi:hypothetical protein
MQRLRQPRGPWYRHKMSGRAALSSEASPPRLLVLDGGTSRAATEAADGAERRAGPERPAGPEEQERPAGHERHAGPAASPGVEAHDGHEGHDAHEGHEGHDRQREPEVFEVFEVLAISSNVVRARSAYLFEVGEELSVRLELDGTVSEAVARVRAHLGPDDARITELEIVDRPEAPEATAPPRDASE